MQIHNLGSPLAAKPDERPAVAVEQRGAPAAVGGNSVADGAAPSKQELSEALKKLNDSMLGAAQGLEFSVDEETKDIVVKVVDQNTREVVRQMPSKEALEIAKSLDRMRGLLINQTA